MILTRSYPKDFETTMKYFQLQVVDSCKQFRRDYPPGSFRSAKQVWDHFKPLLIFKNDPNGNELFQSYRTLMGEGNLHGMPGAGDCDCFSLLSCTVAEVNRLPYTVVLASRYRDYPVHIYTKIQGKVIDFTRPKFNTARYYPYLQEFPLFPKY